MKRWWVIRAYWQRAAQPTSSRLVVHWMAAGSLEYPLARVPSERTPLDSSVVGERAVHRESLSRVLRENPESLVAILEALVSSLTGSRRRVVAEREEEETESYALTEV